MEGKRMVEEDLSIEEHGDPVKYWQERSRKAMEAMGIVVGRPSRGPIIERPRVFVLQRPIPITSDRRSQRVVETSAWGVVRRGRPPLPPGVQRVVDGSCDELPIGLVCDTCSTRMPQFTNMVKCTVHYYDQNDVVPFRLFLYCVNLKCEAEMIVERNKDAEDYVVLSGATRCFLPAEEDNAGFGEQLASAGSFSGTGSQDSDLAGDFDRALGLDANDPGIPRHRRKRPRNPTDSFRLSQRTRELWGPPGAPDANGSPVWYEGRIYLGGPRGQRRLRMAQKATRRLRRAEAATVRRNGRTR